MSERGHIAVVGGGLAGLAAACALAASDFRITLYERRPYLGGRASSYQHPGTGEVVDNCQHVLLGCCTNLLHFYRQIGCEHQIRWYDALTFIEPGGRQSRIKPCALPPPFHSSPSFFRISALTLKDKLAIARALLRLAGALPDDHSQPFLEWLRAHRQTNAAISRFWAPVLVSALNEDLDRVSSRYAALVFRESFLKSAEAGRMGLPAVPLSELYGAAGDYITQHGGEVRLRAAIDTIRQQDERVLLYGAEREEQADAALIAVPFDALARMLQEEPAADPLRRQIAEFQTSPITGIHFWFDRQVSDLDHAVLLERTIQWMFHKSRIQNRVASGENAVMNGGSYVELVVSSSKSLVERSRNEILDLALSEFREFFPEARQAQVVKSTVIKEIHATYAPLPGMDDHRPPNITPWDRIFIAGDWTATGWPATMEGAVRSGYLAAEALTGEGYRVPDLPPRGLMKFFVE